MVTVIICDEYATGDPGPTGAELAAAALEQLQRMAQAVDQVARELLESLPKFRPPVETGWPLPIPERPVGGRPGRTLKAPVLQICGRWPSGYR